MFKLAAPFALLAVLLAVEAGAEEPPAPAAVADSWVDLRQMVGTAGWPSGLISDTRLQYRLPLHRSDSIVFQDTFAGFGGRMRIAPAFVDLGPRISIAPIDIFDIEFQGAFTYYWPSSSGLLPYESLTEGTRDRYRGDRHRTDDKRARAGWSVTASASPTLKAKVGPIIALDGWKFEYFHIESPANTTSEFVYEPFWDRRMARDDLAIDHQGALLFEIFDGKSSDMTLMVGGLFRNQWVVQSKDATMQVGGLALFKPTATEAWPMFALQVLPYLKDADRVGGPPAVSFAAIWNFELKRAVHMDAP